jgi:tripartite-type tricarboxylate transporter receptor subunit TctC
MKRRTFMTSALAAATLLSGGHAGRASSYPQRPVRVIVPFAAGGGTDTLARYLAKHFSETLGGSFYVENFPGAGGGIGAAATQRADADGHTLMMSTAGISAINGSLYKQLSYDPAAFLPVSRVASTDFALVVNPALPVGSVEELIAYARAKPGILTYGTAGIGAAGHLPAELFKSLTKTDITHVPYRGTGPALSDLLSGQISLMFGILGPTLAHIEAGKLKVLATTGRARAAALPQVPTVAEAGVAHYVADEWWGLVAPRGTPGGVIDALNAAMRAYVQNEASRERLVREGYIPQTDTPQAFADIIEADRRKWGDVIRGAGISLG